ncbi:shikimate kinase [Romboutsia sp.]|uniref:shikimate kinase n=1 Tax=Romboutsia sp. TaxID=1965302 RepID=UPI003F3EE776
MRMIMIGFMGVGKTTIGKSIAKKLNINFIDMDDEIEKKEKCTISEIFDKNGEKYFRTLEAKLLSELIKKDDLIISTGGGIITTEENCKILKREEKVVFLDAKPETIINHVSNEINQRPLLKNSLNLNRTISDLLEQRRDKYEEVSDITIDVNNKNIEEVISQILVYIR